MRIDSHQHFWRFDHARHGWITDQMDVLKRDFLPEHLIPELQDNGMDACITVQVEHSSTETMALLDLAHQHREIVGVVGWVDLAAEDIEPRLRQLAQFPKLRGFRHIVQAEPDDRYMLRPDFLRGIAALRPFGFTFDILIYPRQLPAAVELVQRFPGQSFVIDHIAKPLIKDGGPSAQRDWARHMRRLAGGPNVYCKVSGMVTEADWRHWRNEDFLPYLEVVFEAFGSDRLMFGSDWPVCLLAAPGYRQVKAVVEAYTSRLSPAQTDKIFGLNAARFYGLKL
jgi:L-fuconolactonase